MNRRLPVGWATTTTGVKFLTAQQVFNNRVLLGDTPLLSHSKPQALFKELETHRYVEGPFLGVPSAPINRLWRSKS
jgi:hypothetical protein